VISFPTFLVGSLITWAIISYLFRRWEQTTALLAALYTGGLGIWVWTANLDEPVQRLLFLPVQIDLKGTVQRFGMVLQLQALAQPVVAVSLLLAAVALLLAARVSQGRSFVPFSLVLLAGYLAVSLMVVAPIPAVLMAPLLLAALSAGGVFVLQAGRLGTSAGPLRTLIPPILAFPLFLLAAWYVEQIPLNPQDALTTLTAGRLMALGLLLLLAPVPLHGAQPATAQTAPPVVTALLTLLYQLAVLDLLYRTLSVYPFVADATPLYLWFLFAGIVTAAWGGIAAVGVTHPGRLWGYAALHDWGLILMVLALPGVRSWSLVVFLFGLRAVSLLTAATGLSTLEEQAGALSLSRIQGAGNRLPWNSAAFLLGCLGLAGFPLSAGFTGHWAALQSIAENDWRLAAIALIASGGVVFGCVRMVRVLFGALGNRSLPAERPFIALTAIAALLVTASLAVAPQILDGPVGKMLVTFGR
jgi:NADH:ubiquinone oxidoreductase subunit 2 (subunit N)